MPATEKDAEEETLAIKILVDTRIWALGLKAPFMTKQDPDLELATSAQTFLRKLLQKECDLLFSSHLIAEIFHVLTRKGNEIPPDQAERLIIDLLDRRGSIYRPVSPATFSRCVKLSSASGIHVWDYLVAFPFEDGIDRIYTIDPHFQHPSFQGLTQIENPLGVWKTEDAP